MAQKFDVTKFADSKIEEYDWQRELYDFDNELDKQEYMDLEAFEKKLIADEKALYKKEAVVVYEKTTKEKEVTERKYVIGTEKQVDKVNAEISHKQQKAQVRRCNWTDAFKPKMVVRETKKNKGMER